MLNIREDQIKKIAFGLGGLAAGTMAMKAIEKAIASQPVSGLLGFEGVNTLTDIAPPLLVGIIGAGWYAKNSKKDIGYVGLGAAMAAGAKVIEKVANKTIFSGMEGSEDTIYIDEPDYSQAAIAGYSYSDDEEVYAGTEDQAEIIAADIL